MDPGGWNLAASLRYIQMCPIKEFHSQVTTIASGVLYVDFKAPKFVSPKDVIPQEGMVLAAQNADFLSRTSLLFRR